jgi:hypothetical protein
MISSVELQIVLLLEMVTLRTSSTDALEIKPRDQEQMQQWVDKLCIWASFIDYSSTTNNYNSSSISTSTHQTTTTTTDPLILLHNGLMTM